MLLFDHKLRIRTNPRINEAIKALEVGCRILQEDKGVGAFTFKVSTNASITSTKAGYCNYNKHGDVTVVLNLSTMLLRGSNFNTILLVLAHEIRHALQYNMRWIEYGSHKWLGVTEYKRIGNAQAIKDHYKGKKPLSSYSNTAYYNRPCEQDARKFENRYSNTIKKHPNFAQYKHLLRKGKIYFGL